MGLDYGAEGDYSGNTGYEGSMGYGDPFGGTGDGADLDEMAFNSWLDPGTIGIDMWGSIYDTGAPWPDYPDYLSGNLPGINNNPWGSFENGGTGSGGGGGDADGSWINGEFVPNGNGDGSGDWNQDKFQQALFSFLGPQAEQWAQGNFPQLQGMNQWLQTGGNQPSTVYDSYTGAPTNYVPEGRGDSQPTRGGGQGMTNMYDYMQGLNIPKPDASMLYPTSGWWNSLAPEIKEGAWAPFEEGSNRLAEVLGGGGGGSATGGWSGNAAAGMGRYYADATPAYAMNLWGMTQPGAMAEYGTNVQDWSNKNMWGGQDYTNYYGRLLNDYGVYQQNTMLPYQTAVNLMQPASTNQTQSDSGPSFMSELLGLAGTGIGAYYGGPFGAYMGYNMGSTIGDWL